MSKETTKMRRRTIIASLIALATVLAMAVPAQASQVIEDFSVSSSDTEAGGHPDLGASITLENPGTPEAAKNVTVDFPEGVFGNPQAISTCTSANFALNECLPAAQAGLITVHANYLGNPNYLLGTAPLYNMVTRGDFETARFAFVVPTVDIPINVPITIRTGSDYGLRMAITGITQKIPMASADVTVWGFPANAEHDIERFHIGAPGEPPGCPGLSLPSCIVPTFPSASIPVKPFIDNPSVCTGQPLPAHLTVETYQEPANPDTSEASYPPTTECVKQKFEPVLNIALTSKEADSAAGMDLQLRTAQFLGLSNSPSQLRSATVTLPEGLTINPDAADGQSACLDSQANFGSEAPSACPDNSKIGTFDIRTPALTAPLTGSLYFGEPRPGNQYRVFMISSGFGIYSKLVAEAHPDPQTGRVTMSVSDLPQVPFEEFNMHLFASDRGLMATPIGCTVYAAQGTFTPWNELLAPQGSATNVTVNSGPGGKACPGEIRPFHPRLLAGTSSPIAGKFSSFTLKLDRDDGDQFLGDLNFRMPPGFTGSLRGIGYCPEGAIKGAAQNLGRTELVHPSCPTSSQIGTTNVAAGPGSHPFHAIGKMYLSGPFKGAPLSLAAITPALAGPYDYGVVVVRVALHVDPLTAQVSAASDTVPSIIGGVPIRMRSIQVNIDKPEFTINPTNCSPFTVDSQGIGDQGTVTDFSSYFQVVDCRSLLFKPKMTIRQTGGRKATHRASNPSLRLDLRTRPGDANVKSISVTLSNAFEIDQRHLGNICSEKELVATQCAGRTAIGKAITTTPLLDQPLSGPVYAVSGSGGLPRLAFILNGQVNLVPRAETESVKGGRLKTTAPVVPDAPIGHFALTVFGGKTGYLINTRDICQHTPVVRVSYTAQNGRREAQKVRVKNPSCPTD
jgi:hypothetical protein